MCYNRGVTVARTALDLSKAGVKQVLMWHILVPRWVMWTRPHVLAPTLQLTSKYYVSYCATTNTPLSHLVANPSIEHVE